MPFEMTIPQLGLTMESDLDVEWPRRWARCSFLDGDANDAKAKGIIAEHFPGRQVVGILAHMLAELGGMIHCVTQQQPAIKSHRDARRKDR